jgi:flagellar biosynthesis protein FliQ
MKIYDLMINKSRYSQDYSSLGMASAMTLMGWTVLVALLWSMYSVNDISDIFWPTVFAIPVVFALLSVVTWVLDGCIYRATYFVSRGDLNVENFLVSKLTDGCELNIDFPAFLSGNVFIGMGVCLGAILIKLTFFTSGMVSFIAAIVLTVVGIIFGGLFLIRWVFDLHRKFTKHVQDPNAHKGETNG